MLDDLPLACRPTSMIAEIVDADSGNAILVDTSGDHDHARRRHPTHDG
jgi:hypothetical protein